MKTAGIFVLVWVNAGIILWLCSTRILDLIYGALGAAEPRSPLATGLAILYLAAFPVSAIASAWLALRVARSARPATGHSGYGIASLVLGLLALDVAVALLGVFFAVLVFSNISHAPPPSEERILPTLNGVMWLLLFPVCGTFFGILLGRAGLRQQARKRAFSVSGLLANGALLPLEVAAMVYLTPEYGVGPFWPVYPKETPNPADLNDVEIAVGGGGPRTFYGLTILGSGKVTYESRDQRGRIEQRGTGDISTEQVKELVSEFQEVGFFSLRNRQRLDPPRLFAPPSPYTISLRIGGSKKTVEYRIPPPQDRLSRLRDKIYAATNFERWVR